MHEGKTGLRYPGHAGLGRLRPASGAWAGLISLRVDPRCGETRDKPDYPGKESWRSRSVVGKWGKNLAIRVPMDVAQAGCLMDGEKVEIETLDGDIVCARRAAHAQARQNAEEVPRRSLLKAAPIRWAGFPFGSCWTTDDGGKPRP